jgi:hypothetical protein
MGKVYILMFLFLTGCASSLPPRSAPTLQTPPKGSSGSLGKNIDELDNVMNKSLSRIDRIIAELGGK